MVFILYVVSLLVFLHSAEKAEELIRTQSLFSAGGRRMRARKQFMATKKMRTHLFPPLRLAELLISMKECTRRCREQEVYVELVTSVQRPLRFLH